MDATINETSGAAAASRSMSASELTKQASGLRREPRPSDTDMEGLDFPSPPGYELGVMLGFGKHGVVKKATHLASGRSVAIKSIANKDCQPGAWSEATALQELMHPNVVRLYDIIKCEECTLLVLECLEGGELFDYLVSRQRLAERETRKFVRQIISALEFCHDKGVVHRDLKLENLLLDGAGNIKVTDFGFSNMFREDHLMSTFVGSPSYAAPEILANEKYCGPMVDVWSLGVIVFTLLTGEMPFQEDNIAISLDRINRAAFEMPDYLSEDAQDLISSILKRNPEERWSLQRIKASPWLAHDEQASKQAEQATPEIEIQERVLGHMAELGYNKEQLKTAVETQLVNEATATYSLLLDKFAEEKKEEDRDAEIAAASARLAGLLGDSGRRCRAESMTGTRPRRPFLNVGGAAVLAEVPEESRDPSRSASPSRDAQLLPTFQPRGRAQTWGSMSRPRRATTTAQVREAPPRHVAADSKQNTGFALARTMTEPARDPPEPSTPPRRSMKAPSQTTLNFVPVSSPLPLRTDEVLSPILAKRSSTMQLSRSISRRKTQATSTRSLNRRSLQPGALLQQNCRVTTLGETSETSRQQVPAFRRMTMIGTPTRSQKFRSRLNSEEEARRSRPSSTDPLLPMTEAVGQFNADTTSSLPANQIVGQLKKALKKEQISTKLLGAHKLECVWQKVERRRGQMVVTDRVAWHMEVCRIKHLGMQGIKLHRLSGDIWKYKQVVADVMRWVKL
eukprot:m.68699 g.68699  ORF g.68699 m.68699 type:complete len:739 (+) comp13921_c0_seq2:375-2591(+)